MRFHLQTLGCPKNEVDSEGMAKLLARAGHSPIDKPAKADVVIVNTCGFIDIAIDESTQALKDLAARKRPGQVLIAAGCLAQRYADRLRADVPQIDAIVGTRELERIVSVVEDAKAGAPRARVEAGCPSGVAKRGKGTEAYAPNPIARAPSAYLKIADGCSAGCAFCVIPQIKGPYRSKPVDQVAEEARQLAATGVKEVVLIAQDTTAYGFDWGERDALADLIPTVVTGVPDLAWLRIMYAYPTHVTDRFIEAMARHPQVCHYLDLPLQHGHPAVLKRMRRPSDVDATRGLIRRLRQAMPDIALRTSLIVGFPGETEAEYRTLLDFMEEIVFDRLGIFTYSRQADTPATAMPAQVPEKEKRRRYERAMELQQGISLRRNRAQVGRELDVLVEGVAETGSDNANAYGIVGRTYRDAPEVDGLIFCQGTAKPGDLVRVKVVDALEYDLVARIIQTFEAKSDVADLARSAERSARPVKHGKKELALSEKRG